MLRAQVPRERHAKLVAGSMVFRNEARALEWFVDGRLSVLVSSEKDPSDGEWDAYLDVLQHWGRPGEQRVLVVTLGGGPTTMQRARLMEMVRRNQLPEHAGRSAVVTSSLIARGIATAVSWFYSAIKSFALDDLEGAMEYLELRPEERGIARAAVRRLARALQVSIPGFHTDQG